MREYHCDALRDLKVPDEMIEKALAIPAAAGAAKAAVRPFRRMIAAAAVILVAFVSVSAYFLFRNIDSSPMVAAPAPSETKADPSAAGEDTQPPTAPSETAVIDPTEPPTNAPTVPNSPTVPADRPTQGAAVRPEPVQPIPTVPAYIPTEPPVQPPTTPAPAPTEAPIEPSEEPAEPTKATEPVAPRHDRELASVGYMVPIGSYTGSEDLYCRLYASSGKLIGEEDLFDESRRVYFTTGSGYLFLSYPLSGIVDPLPPDNYTIVFYDGDGNDFYICSAFLSRK